MIKYITKLFFHKTIILNCVYLDKNKVYGKVNKHLKCPSISFEEKKYEKEINIFFESFNNNFGQIDLKFEDIKYYPKLNILGIQLRWSKYKTILLTFNTLESDALEYIFAIFLSKNFLLHNNTNVNIYSEITFENKNEEFDIKIKEYLLPEIINKLGILGLKRNPKYSNLDNLSINKIINENPEYTKRVYEITRERWIIKEEN